MNVIVEEVLTALVFVSIVLTGWMIPATYQFVVMGCTSVLVILFMLPSLRWHMQTGKDVKYD